jgi:putative ABC transport system ATP-binding protein
MSAALDGRRLGVATVFSDVDVEVVAGEMVALAGPSLSGKTTLVEVLAGWRRPDAGSMSWNGGAAVASSGPPWSALTVVPQSFALLEELSVVENILLSRRVARQRRDGSGSGSDRLEELLATLGLTRLRDRGGYEISVGERQRTMVARAVVDRPDIVLADEPVAHQDEHHAGIVLGLLRGAAAAGAAVVVATRQPDVAALADRTITLAP